jgi:predicted molibdopterin-dependent oxidoreductase YjgC
LVNGMMQAILRKGLAREEFIQSRTEGIEGLKRSLEEYSAEKVEALTGVGADSLLGAARMFAKAARGVILISTGQASGKQDAALARATSNLALLAGQVGKESCGIYILGEKNNAQGALDMGVTPGLLPGYADLMEPAERSRFEKAWKMTIPDRPGLGALGILQAAEEGKVRGLYIAGENPAVAYPDAGRTKKALAALDFLVVQDCFLTETASLAHVILPAVTFVEKEGTFTNVERRIQRVRPALRPIGEARPDLWIFQELAKAMGTSFGQFAAQSVMDEIRSLVPLYGGMEYTRLDESSGLQWPCPSADHPGTPMLYEKDFPRGKARLIPAVFEPEGADPEFPYFLITGPTLFHSGSLSTMSPGLLRLRGQSYVEVHPADAAKLGLTNYQEVTLESRNGKVTVKAAISERAAPNVLFVPYHFGPNGGNQLTGRDLKTVRVKIEKM